jgi:hypothetical protein
MLLVDEIVLSLRLLQYANNKLHYTRVLRCNF